MTKKMESEKQVFFFMPFFPPKLYMFALGGCSPNVALSLGVFFGAVRGFPPQFLKKVFRAVGRNR